MSQDGTTHQRIDVHGDRAILHLLGGLKFQVLASAALNRTVRRRTSNLTVLTLLLKWSKSDDLVCEATEEQLMVASELGRSAVYSAIRDLRSAGYLIPLGRSRHQLTCPDDPPAGDRSPVVHDRGHIRPEARATADPNNERKSMIARALARATVDGARAVARAPSTISDKALEIADKSPPGKEVPTYQVGTYLPSQSEALRSALRALQLYDDRTIEYLASHPNCSIEQIRVAVSRWEDAHRRQPTKYPPSGRAGYILRAIEMKFRPLRTAAEQRRERLPEHRQEQHAAEEMRRAEHDARRRHAERQIESLSPAEVNEIVERVLATYPPGPMRDNLIRKRDRARETNVWRSFLISELMKSKTPG